MGCNGIKPLEEIDEKDNHKFNLFPLTKKLNKNEKIDFSENKNKYIMNCSNYFNNENPFKFKDKKFEDKLFYSQKFSKQTEELLQLDNSNIEWKSAKEIFGDNVKIFGENISIKDIKLGPADNSYFVSAISSISEFPNLILQLFRTVSLPNNGEPIEVCIKIEGKWTVICLDDKFMVNKENNIPVFSTSPTKNIWGMILEKAWAKVCGGYENIINGNCNEIFEAFTPFNIIEIDLTKEKIDTLWKFIYSCFEYNCLMACDIKKDIKDFEEIGLINNHWFSILGYQEEKDEKSIKKDIKKLIKMRNPLGDKEIFKKITNEEMMEKVGIEKFLKNGIFLIDYYKIKKLFEKIIICIPICDLKSYLIEIPKEKACDYGIIRILIEKESNLSISIVPLSNRFHEDIIKDKEIFKNLILIQLLRNNKSANYISSSLNESLFINVKPGEYICIFNCDYNIPNVVVRPFNINISSTTSIKYYLDEPDNKLQLLKHIMISKIESLPKYKERFKENFVVFTGNKFEFTSFGFCYIKNNQKQTKYIKPSIYLRNFKSIEGILPTTLKMIKNSIFFFLFNRIKTKSNYQTGANVSFFKNEIDEAIEPISYKNIPEKYCKEIEYKENECDYELV